MESSSDETGSSTVAVTAAEATLPQAQIALSAAARENNDDFPQSPLADHH